MENPKKILIFSRMHITNYGDPIIGDCCKYIIEKTARECGVSVEVTIADVYEKNQERIAEELHGKHAVVFPGGGLNSVKFNRILLEILKLAEEQGDIKVFFNAVGIKRTEPNEKNEKLLVKMFKKKQVVQITTRGDYAKLLEYLKKPYQYPPKLVIDPAIWVDEAYGIERKENAEKIGIGIIRPEIFETNKSELLIEDVFLIYTKLIQELENRGYQWELFGNGTKSDIAFGRELLSRMGRWHWRYMKRNVKSGRELTQRIAGYRGIIAARLHANILASSLRIPSVGLVWNEKMNFFADVIGLQQRYVNGEKLLDAPFLVDQLELAMRDGYNEQKIADIKAVTVETIKNIILG